MAAVVFAVASLAGSCGFQTGTDHPDAPSTDKDPLNASWSFAVWAPNAEAVFVQGDFNDWSETSHPMQADGAGHWQAGIRGAKPGDDYQFVIHYQGRTLYRPDPRARALTSSIGHSVIVDSNGYQWQHAGVQLPSWNEQIIYELHIGSFNDVPGGGPGTFLTAIERLDALAELGVNIVELLPINEFSGDFSWGYNGSHPFALESGYGTPDEFRAFVDAAHARGIGVIVDVVYNHWGPQDLSLWCFDGPCYGEGNGGIYFYTDWRRESGWGPRPNFGQEEVRDFIADNAMMWLDEYRVDGLRFDSTINIRKASGTDLPEGWSLLQQINDRVDARYPGRMMIAEDLQGDDWVTKQTSDGGAGFDAQWDGGFFHPIHEALIATEDAHRSMPAVAQALRGGLAPFTRIAYTENHDEVANGKQRLPVMIAPGDPSGYYARKRSMLGATLVLTTPAIPMLFQGQEMLEDGYFRDDDPVDWSRAQAFAPVRAMYRDLIALRRNAAGTTRGLTGDRTNVFHVNDTDKVIAMHRWHDAGTTGDTVVIANFADVAYQTYQVGVPSCGTWHVRFNSDALAYGADFGNLGVASVTATTISRDGMPCSISLPLGRYAAVILSK